MSRKSLSEKGILENRAGGKESKVEIYIEAVKGRQSITLWDWSAKITVTRNGHPFSSQGNNKPNESLVHLINRLFDDIRSDICNAYKNSNVDYDPVCRFISEAQKKFMAELSAEK